MYIKSKIQVKRAEEYFLPKAKRQKTLQDALQGQKTEIRKSRWI